MVKIILVSKNIRNLGSIGDVVSVKAGYASYMIKQRYAVFATTKALDELEHKKESYTRALQESVNYAESIKNSIAEVKSITMNVKTTPEGKLFGSVTPRDIASEISTRYSVSITSDNVIITGGSIKEIGQYDIEIFLLKGISHFMNLIIVSENNSDSVNYVS